MVAQTRNMASHGWDSVHGVLLDFISKYRSSFQNINNDFTKFSAKGQVPFVEVNGRQIGDSNFIIETVKEEFKVRLAFLFAMNSNKRP